MNEHNNNNNISSSSSSSSSSGTTHFTYLNETLRVIISAVFETADRRRRRQTFAYLGPAGPSNHCGDERIMQNKIFLFMI